jgi:hypothetical protein
LRRRVSKANGGEIGAWDMRKKLSKYARIGGKALILAAPVLLAASVAIPAGLDRLSAEFQSGKEILVFATPAPSPVAPAAPGGNVVYDKTLNIPPGVA